MIKRSKAATACRKRKRLATISTVEFAEREIEQSRSYRQALELPSKAAATGRSPAAPADNLLASRSTGDSTP
jgi:hypothetical protein